MTPIESVRQAMMTGDHDAVGLRVREALAAGCPPEKLLDEGLVAGMRAMNERFRSREIYLPDMLLAARAWHAGLELLKPRLETAAMPWRGRVILGTIQGDLHDIGKNLVATMLRCHGFEVIDLGVGVSAEAFVEAARSRDAQVLGMSALLTTTMPRMKEVIAALNQAGLEAVRTIVGGAPVTEGFARGIGADGYAYDASRAVEVIGGWLAPVS